MESSQVLHYLDIWRDWMKSYNLKLGYKTKSSGFLTGSIHSFDDLEDEVDNKAAQTVDKCIDDLSTIERTAIYVRWMGEKTLVNPIMIDMHYDIALSKLAKKLPEQGLY
jgi:hypothetical protein